MAGRAASGHSCVLAIDKPGGLSSHDVVNRVRRVFGERRVGHFGTLDPLARGVLLVGVGPATRLDRYLVEHDKRYVATIVFGQQRSTDDAEGEVLDEAPCPDELLDEAYARGILSCFTGVSLQVPPQYSAIKVAGKTAYSRARAGEAVDLSARGIEVYQADLLGISTTQVCGSNGTPGDHVVWQVAFHVSKGTYIRALARDIGNRVGCGAFLGALERSQVGEISLADCVSLESLSIASPRVDVTRVLGYPVVRCPAALWQQLQSGNPLLTGEAYMPGQAVSVLEGEKLKAVYRSFGGQALRCECLFSTPVSLS